MATEWTRRDVVHLLDSYVGDLRILARRFGEVGLTEELCQPADWPVEDRSLRTVYDFELAGIKASGYPELLTRPTFAEYATPKTFVEFIATSLGDLPRSAFLVQEWRRLPVETIELDSRYVAFRTAHDWVVLHARILAANNATSDEVLDLSDRVDPFRVQLPCDHPDEPAGVIAGSPLYRASGGFRNQWNPNYGEPWPEVVDQIDAIHFFHFRGALLFLELRGSLHHEGAGKDPRLMRLELLTPQAFAEFVATRIVEDQNTAAFHLWHNRPPGEVERDLRYMAHKCSFDHYMIRRMAWQARPPEPGPSRAEALEIVKEVGFEGYELIFGEEIEDDGKPN